MTTRPRFRRPEDMPPDLRRAFENAQGDIAAPARPKVSPATHLTEHVEAVNLMRAVRQNTDRFPALAQLFHTPNEAKRSKAVAGRLKAEGLVAGIPDYLLLVPVGPWHGAAFELKRVGQYPTPEQRARLGMLRACGYAAEWGQGWHAGWSFLLAYVGGTYAPSENGRWRAPS